MGVIPAPKSSEIDDLDIIEEYLKQNEIVTRRIHRAIVITNVTTQDEPINIEGVLHKHRTVYALPYDNQILRIYHQYRNWSDGYSTILSDRICKITEIDITDPNTLPRLLEIIKHYVADLYDNHLSEINL